MYHFIAVEKCFLILVVEECAHIQTLLNQAKSAMGSQNVYAANVLHFIDHCPN